MQDELLWTCLAGLAVQNRDLDTAEQAYVAIDLFDKVSFVQYIKVRTKCVFFALTLTYFAHAICIIRVDVEKSRDTTGRNGVIGRKRRRC